jgi:CubicO group peptidase (beta-lactamase class C family)
MKLKKSIAILVLIAFSTSLVAAQVPRGPQGVKANTINLNKAAFDQSLSSAVGPKVMGYQYVLIKDGRLVTEKAGGLAQTSKDNGPLNMTTRTPLNIGSLQKFVTGTTLLNLMEHPTQWSPGVNKSLRNQLDMAIWGQFPSIWTDLIPGTTVPCPQIRCIKYRQLLQHRAGFNNDKASNRTVLGFLGDGDGFLPSQYDKRVYSNINFVLTGYLLPGYERNYFLNEIMANAVKYPNTSSADQYVRDQLGKRYNEILHERIFDKMTPKINPTCNGANTVAATAAYGYQTKNDAKPGIITSAVDKKGHCSGEGGYYWTARDFANYVAHFSASNLIVSDSTRDTMYTEGMDADDRLVWSSAKSDDWMEQHFQMPVIVWSNGVVEGTRAVLIRLPQNYYLVLFTNSEDMSAGDLYNAGVAAFKAGMDHNFAS